MTVKFTSFSSLLKNEGAKIYNRRRNKKARRIKRGQKRTRLHWGTEQKHANNNKHCCIHIVDALANLLKYEYNILL